MMIRKKHFSAILLLVTILACFSGCREDEFVARPCESDGGTPITGGAGRIYKWNRSEPHFYYIGNTQLVTTGVNGGYISCNELPQEFQVEGIEITYSGLIKGAAFCDTCDPLFAHIQVTSIERLE